MEVMVMTVHVAKHDFLHVHPFKFIVGTLVFIIALLLLASNIFMGLLLTIELISG
jgi:hypothetical protein